MILADEDCSASQLAFLPAKVVDPLDPSVKLGDSKNFKYQQLVQPLS